MAAERYVPDPPANWLMRPFEPETVTVAGAIGAAAVHGGRAAMAAATLFAAFMGRFLWNPEFFHGAAHLGPKALYFPSHGRILSVTHHADTPLVTVSAFLSVFDTHTVYSPIAGTVEQTRHEPGLNLPAYKENAKSQRLTTTITPTGTPPTVVHVEQITGALARRIVRFVKADEGVQAHQRIGFIKFGSRVTLTFDRRIFRIVEGLAPGQRVDPGSLIALAD